MKIMDGIGKGFEAEVDKNKRLSVKSYSRGSEELTAVIGDSYILHAQCHLSANASGGLLAFTFNDDDLAAHVTRIYIDAQTLTKNIIINQIKNPDTLTNGTDITSSGVVNKRFDSPKTIDGTLLVSDGSSDLTISGGQDYHSFPIKSLESASRDMRASNILTAGRTIAFSWKTADGANAVDGEIISLSINLFVTEKEES